MLPDSRLGPAHTLIAAQCSAVETARSPEQDPCPGRMRCTETGHS